MMPVEREIAVHSNAMGRGALFMQPAWGGRPIDAVAMRRGIAFNAAAMVWGIAVNSSATRRGALFIAVDAGATGRGRCQCLWQGGDRRWRQHHRKGGAINAASMGKGAFWCQRHWEGDPVNAGAKSIKNEETFLSKLIQIKDWVTKNWRTMSWIKSYGKILPKNKKKKQVYFSGIKRGTRGRQKRIASRCFFVFTKQIFCCHLNFFILELILVL